MRLLAGKSLRDELTMADVNKYVEVDRSLLPEVFSDSPPPQELMHPKGGCSGLQVTKESSALLPGSLMAVSVLEVLGFARQLRTVKSHVMAGMSVWSATCKALRSSAWLLSSGPCVLRLELTDCRHA